MEVPSVIDHFNDCVCGECMDQFDQNHPELWETTVREVRRGLRWVGLGILASAVALAGAVHAGNAVHEFTEEVINDTACSLTEFAAMLHNYTYDC